MTEQFHSWVYIKKKKQNPISQCSQQHYLKLPRIQKQLKCPLTDKWNKMWCVHTHTQMEYYSVTKQNEILSSVATWMDLEGTILSEVSQRKKYCMISLICGI